MKKRLEAFTLIELLIVVAIIAILAAIAVPNFLEAQVRAKVSRAKADMRSMATAIESYHVDWNRYPDTRGSRHPNLEGRWARLTTPVAYLTTIFEDPFGDRVEISNWNSPNPQYRVYEFLTWDIPDVRTSEHRSFYANLVANGFTTEAKWYVASQGPDETIGLATPAPPGFIVPPGGINRAVGLVYDPTNGTISAGDVIRVGPGVGQLN